MAIEDLQIIGLADGTEPFLNYRYQIVPASLMNSVLVMHSKQEVRDGAATEGTPRKAGCIKLM